MTDAKPAVLSLKDEEWFMHRMDGTLGDIQTLRAIIRELANANEEENDFQVHFPTYRN